MYELILAVTERKKLNLLSHIFNLIFESYRKSI